MPKLGILSVSWWLWSTFPLSKLAWSLKGLLRVRTFACRSELWTRKRPLWLRARLWGHLVSIYILFLLVDCMLSFVHPPELFALATLCHRPFWRHDLKGVDASIRGLPLALWCNTSCSSLRGSSWCSLMYECPGHLLVRQAVESKDYLQ